MSKQLAYEIVGRIKRGEMPDFIQTEMGLTPARQHKIVRTMIANSMLAGSRAMRQRSEYPFNRGVLDYREWDAALVKIEAWAKIRSLKRQYDRMNKAQKAKNKASFARQIDAMLLYLRAAYEIADGTFDADEYKRTYEN
jgi:tellurite resistance protein